MASTVAAWPTVALGEVLRKSDEWVDLKPDTEYAQVTVRLWGKGVALRGRVQGGQIAASSQLRVRQNQFILSRIDARNGAFGLVTPELDGAVVSNDFPVFNLDESRIIPAYLNWLSKTHDFVEMCQRASEGTTNRVRLKEERFLALNIPLPPLEEQRRNVARIEALAGRIAEARGLRQAATAETIAARYSWWRAWRQRLLAPNISTEQLGDIAWITSGGTPARDNASYWGGNVPWVKSGELNDNDIYSTEECITEAAIEGSSAKLFPPDTVLVALYGHTRGKTARLRISATTNQACCAILPCEQLDAAYLQY
ncbi:MAG TPA: restriction endonuclease subunit S, partial [Ktedonobacterales bacterium]